MRKTIDEILAMGREGFVDAMVAELEAKVHRPGLPPEERERLQRCLDRVKAELAERDQPAAAKRAA